MAIARFDEFVIGQDDWSVYTERLELYFEAYAIPPERQVPVLLSSVGAETYSFMRNLCDGKPLKDHTFAELCETMKIHFQPRVSVFRKRIEFYDLRQMPNETISLWFSQIKKLSIGCQFGNNLDFALKDKFVHGLRDKAVQDRLCEEDTNKNLLDLYDLAVRREWVLSISEAVHTSKMVVNTRKNKDDKKPCRACGLSHDFRKCKFKACVCSRCKKKGHLAAVCSMGVNIQEDLEELDQSDGQVEGVFIKTEEISIDDLDATILPQSSDHLGAETEEMKKTDDEHTSENSPRSAINVEAVDITNKKISLDCPHEIDMLTQENSYMEVCSDKNNEDVVVTGSNSLSFKQYFDKKLVEYDQQNQGSLHKPWTMERILEVINEIKRAQVAMNSGQRRSSMEYYWMRKYDVMNYGSEDYLIFKRSTPTEPMVYIAPREQYFDILSEIHEYCGHGGRDKMLYYIKSRYYIPKKAVEMFVSLCPICETKKQRPKKRHCNTTNCVT